MSVEADDTPIWVENTTPATSLPTPSQPTQPLRSVPATSQRSNSNSQSIVSIFSLKFYASYFDVDTVDVLRRSLLALNPFTPRQVFLFHTDDNVDPAPADLYGPFWITSSVIFFLFFASSVTGLVISSFVDHTSYEYRFDLLTGAASMLYSYTFVWPPILWAVTRYQGLLTEQPNATFISFISLYGYSNIVWIPVAILAVMPLDGLLPTFTEVYRWCVVFLGYAFSSVFLGRNLKTLFIPRESANVAVDRKPGFAFLTIALLLHVALAISVKYLFFANELKNSNETD